MKLSLRASSPTPQNLIRRAGVTSHENGVVWLLTVMGPVPQSDTSPARPTRAGRTPEYMKPSTAALAASDRQTDGRT